ncbi:hypothetical protein CTA2_9491 [Colletotrichum tanaceti]|nr:hypothetical protein CTA2_9491 [Colletotrichum tanaceti]
MGPRQHLPLRRLPHLLRLLAHLWWDPPPFLRGLLLLRPRRLGVRGRGAGDAGLQRQFRFHHPRHGHDHFGLPRLLPADQRRLLRHLPDPRGHVRLHHRGVLVPRHGLHKERQLCRHASQGCRCFLLCHLYGRVVACLRHSVGVFGLPSGAPCRRLEQGHPGKEREEPCLSNVHLLLCRLRRVSC